MTTDRGLLHGPEVSVGGSCNRASTLLHMYNEHLHLILKELAYGPAPNGGLPRYF